MGKLFNGLIIPLIGVIAIIAAIATSNEFLVIVAIFGGLCLLVIIIAALMNKSNKEERRLAENRRQQEEAYKNFRPATAVPGEAAGLAEPEVEVVMLGEKKNIKCTYTTYPLGDIAGGDFKAELQGDKPERHKVLKNYNKTLLECDVRDIVERWDREDEKNKQTENRKAANSKEKKKEDRASVIKLKKGREKEIEEEWAAWMYPYLEMKADRLRTKLNSVRTDVFSRFNNELTRSEKVRIDNRITRNLFNVEVEALTRKEREFVEIQKEVEKIRAEYYELLNGSSEEISVGGMDLGLFDMTPREFEVFSADLLGKMGYVDIELTQYTNDRGVDIIAYKDDVRYAVQCKRYKEPVGSPDMQKFIGAMMHAKADKGLFITTSRFTREAERMAAEHPIELIDRFKIPILLKDK